MGTRVGVYNSLVVDPESLACEWQVNAWCQEQREVQAMMWSSLGQAPAYGLQFHPESFLSEGAATILNNWIRVLLAYRSTT
jgi:anthranilate/para-aminobenzoate synthase component II